jgi:DNA-binding protein H-NS
MIIVHPTLVTCPCLRELRAHAPAGYRYRNIQDTRHSMADYDLEALSLPELKKMQKDIAKAISTFEDRQKAEARAKVEALARDLGYSLAELVGTETKSSRTPAAAKYRHPENPALTWSGRGRKPQWFVEELEEGKTASDLAIS